jgi:hypothetical protein
MHLKDKRAASSLSDEGMGAFICLRGISSQPRECLPDALIRVHVIWLNSLSLEANWAL